MTEARPDEVMLAVPMLADFAVRLAFGLIAALALTSWRAVPLRFFRIQSQIALAVLVLAALSSRRPRRGLGRFSGCWSRAPRRRTWPRYLGTGAAVDRDRHGWPRPRLDGRLDDPRLEGIRPVRWALMAAGRAVSGLLLGATLHSMLLGHYYLIAPAMTSRR